MARTCSFLCIIAMLLSGIQSALAATATLPQLEQQISRFEQQPEAQLAPTLLQNARALLLRARQNDSDTPDPALLEQAANALEEARQASLAFREKYSDLLELRQDVTQALELMEHEQKEPLAVAELAQQKAGADTLLAKVIRATEAGNLNESQALAKETKDAYQQLLITLMPGLADLAEAKLKAARRAGARKYALHTYAQAKEKLIELRAFTDGLAEQIPKRPADAWYLAAEAERLAKKIKQLRKDYASHEELILASRALRLKLAEALGMQTDKNNPLADVSAEDLLTRIAAIKQEMEHERLAHSSEIERLKKQHQQEMEALKKQMLEAGNAQLARMKEAFRAKLERETFESKRLHKLRQLFKNGEVEILAKADGSLLIRLSSLKFDSGSAAIHEKYYRLLRRLKDALDLYAERKVRIEGHTDNRGEVKYNQILSLKRAEAVRDFLVKSGVDAARIRSFGFGEVRPIASNEFEKGRAMNRRIDIIIEPSK